MTQSHEVGPYGLLLTTREVAAQLRVSERTVRRLRSQGEFPLLRRVGRSWRYPQADVTDYVQRCTEATS